MGEPGGSNVPSLSDEYIVWIEGTRGTETSKYSQEKKETSIPSVAASERGRAQTGGHAHRGCGSATCTVDLSRRGMESPAKEGNSPVHEKIERLADTRVPQDTRNPAGSRRDHPPRLNTIW